jgi:hypothetical protein
MIAIYNVANPKQSVTGFSELDLRLLLAVRELSCVSGCLYNKFKSRA